MSISSGALRKAGPFLGAGSVVACPFTFKVFAASDLVVTKTDSLGVETVYAITTDYTVNLNADQEVSPGGSINTVAALASGSQIVITSNMPQTQPLVLANQGGFYPTAINDALDRLTILIQQISERVSRALVTPVSGTISASLPAPAPNYVIGWNGLGTALVNLVNATGTAISSAMQAFVTSASKSAARLELVVSGQFQEVTRIPSLTGTNALVGSLAVSPGAYAAGLKVSGIPNAANSITNPTLNLNGLGAVTIEKRDSSGVKVALAVGDYNASGPFTFEHDGTDFILLDPLPASVAAQTDKILPISVVMNTPANGMTISAGTLTLDFRDTSLPSGTVTTVTGTPANLVISSGSTLGTVSGVASKIAILAINNGGTIELAAVNAAGGIDLSETWNMATTAEGGAGAADSANVVYSAAARTGKSYRVLGVIQSTQVTAGLWASAATLVQGAGGQAMPFAFNPPTGTIIDFAGTVAPSGYLACPITATNVSRTSYAALFAAIGTTWGAGDGSTTFGMPWFPANYTATQANANVGTAYAGDVISHSHTTPGYGAAGGGANFTTAAGASTVATGSTGGGANLAAGHRVLKCVKY